LNLQGLYGGFQNIQVEGKPRLHTFEVFNALIQFFNIKSRHTTIKARHARAHAGHKRGACIRRIILIPHGFEHL
jgi:hypothetical protein